MRDDRLGASKDRDTARVGKKVRDKGEDVRRDINPTPAMCSCGVPDSNNLPPWTRRSSGSECENIDTMFVGEVCQAFLLAVTDKGLNVK